jgi:isochorismate synthase EntC
MDRQQGAIDTSEAAREKKEQEDLDNERNAGLTKASKNLQEEQLTYDNANQELNEWIDLMNEAESEE